MAVHSIYILHEWAGSDLKYKNKQCSILILIIMLAFLELVNMTDISIIKNRQKRVRVFNCHNQSDRNTIKTFLCNRVKVINPTSTNSLISWRSVLLVKETGVPGENHRPVASL